MMEAPPFGSSLGGPEWHAVSSARSVMKTMAYDFQNPVGIPAERRLHETDNLTKTVHDCGGLRLGGDYDKRRYSE